jgi:hypothetical protein
VPIHPVTVNSSLIDRRPATNRQFKNFVKATGHYREGELSDGFFLECRRRAGGRIHGRGDRTSTAARLAGGIHKRGAKDMIGAVTGLVTLLLALVLGLLIWTAFGVYSTQKASIQTMALNDLRFDAALQEFGPEAEEGRKLLMSGIEHTVVQIWGGEHGSDFVTKNYRHAISSLKERQVFLNSLQPSSDKQRAAQAEALQDASAIGQARLQMTLALVDPVNYSLLCVVVAWATCLFCGYGLLAKRHPMSYIVLALGALAIASALEVMIDLSDPYSGLFQVSPHPLTDVLRAISSEVPPDGRAAR